MTYQDYFVTEIKVNGKIMRVKDGAVYLPYGSEYSILLKNLNTKRAAVKVSIDGDDVLDNSSLILDANSESELKGFLRGNVAKNRFRFIHKTKQISEHRGDRADDGLVRIEFAFEKPKPEPPIVKAIDEIHHHYHYHSDIDWYKGGGWTYYNSNDGTGNAVDSQACSYTVQNCARNITSPTVQDSLGVEPNADEGITVKGSQISQQFRYASIGDLEEPKAIIIQLKGITDSGKVIQQPITVKTKLTCPTCGTKCKSSMKFCGNCGTFLE
jgi:hypothetical protein